MVDCQQGQASHGNMGRRPILATKAANSSCSDLRNGNIEVRKLKARRKEARYSSLRLCHQEREKGGSEAAPDFPYQRKRLQCFRPDDA
ncbi:hypothetical protein MRB53_036287 [Persea americana]|nr:hypothetical protein MRB53_042439 [Persea americana]KAJ8614799.1 hypothetical protein MRB53_036465 [Persea americana]KAJ8614874.1 hypothetical protein MRB53_036287 [Persea americana]